MDTAKTMELSRMYNKKKTINVVFVIIQTMKKNQKNSEIKIKQKPCQHRHVFVVAPGFVSQGFELNISRRIG